MERLKQVLASIGLLNVSRKIFDVIAGSFVGNIIYKVFRKRQQLNRNYLLKSNHISIRSEGQDVIETLSLLKVSDKGIPMVRVGGQHDGGYLIPSNLKSIDGCFSPGVAESSEFELYLAELGIASFLADASVDGPAAESELFDFEKKYLGLKDTEGWIRLDTWVQEKLPSARNLILQIDIEGGEWPVLLDVDEQILGKFAIIVVEFHDLHMVGTKTGATLINQVLKKLDRQFTVCHITPNNTERIVSVSGLDVPPLLEVTYIRKDMQEEFLGQGEALNRNLAVRNDLKMPAITLSEFWYEA